MALAQSEGRAVSGDSRQAEKKVRILTAFAIVLLVISYFVPIWWVSLTAPNYPKDAFPDGIKIHFHFNGVKNGCKVVEGTNRAAEIYEGDLGGNPEEERTAPLAKGSGLDCVHEMDTINHYVGMFPIVTGAPVEMVFSKYIFAIMLAMLMAFLVPAGRGRIAILGVSFALIAAWMLGRELSGGGLNDLVVSYRESLGTYFKDHERINSMSATLHTWASILGDALLVLMAFLFAAAILVPKIVNVFPLLIAPIPFYFILDFGGWLWFFGHHLHPWGAFTLKPFMPTVFGEGKVAQFATFSYPHFGFLLLILTMIALVLAFLIRRKHEVK